MSWIKDQETPEYFDVQMTGLISLLRLRLNRSFYYLVRAVTPGTFNMGPVSADAMYNGEYHSIHGFGTVIVQ